MSFQMTEDRGARLENLVYMHLRREGFAPEYYITKKGNEVDFVLRPESRGERQLIQVCWNLKDPKTKQREVDGLLSAMDELQLKRGTIVTWLDEEAFDESIDIIPAWKWFLSNPSR
ncbi:MAG: hypothetical protein COZ95_05320 [Nitrospirae bacterium CG_4_8_14_3_um_filter_50_41]|nr:MAG: hypothetical protein COZ95_05320 [Nitrospirae bacterium CG_4_8_14_3_um_filter_50_41]